MTPLLTDIQFARAYGATDKCAQKPRFAGLVKIAFMSGALVTLPAVLDGNWAQISSSARAQVVDFNPAD